MAYKIQHLSFTMVMALSCFCWITARPVARINFRGVRDRKKVDLLDPTFGLFEPNPLNPSTKTPFLAHSFGKSGPFGRFGVVRRTPRTPPGYGPDYCVEAS